MEETSRHSAPPRNVIRHGNRTVLIRSPAAHDAMKRYSACVISAYCDRRPRFNLLRIGRCPIQSRTPAVHFPNRREATRVVVTCTYVSPWPFVNDSRNIRLAIRIVTPAQSVAHTVNTAGMELSCRNCLPVSASWHLGLAVLIVAPAEGTPVGDAARVVVARRSRDGLPLDNFL